MKLLALKKHYYSIVFIILAANIFGQYVGLAYLLLLPAIHTSFATSKNITQLIVPFYLAGFAVAQLFAGFIAELIGRQKTIFLGIIMIITGGFICLQSLQFWLLLLSFFLQAFGVGFLIPATDAIVRDNFSGQRETLLFTMINISLAIGAILSPIAGGFIEMWLGWRWVFVLLIFISLALFVFSFLFLRETKPRKSKNFYITYLNECIKNFCGNRHYLGCALISGLLAAIMASFNTAAPFILHTVFHSSYREIAFFLAVPNITMVIGLIASDITNRFLSPITVIGVGIVLICISALSMVILALLHSITIFTLMLPMSAIGFCIGLITPNYWVEALLPFARTAVSAAAFIIFLQNILGVCASLLISKLPEDSHIPLAIVIFGLTILCALVYHFNLRNKPVKKVLEEQL